MAAGSTLKRRVKQLEARKAANTPAVPPDPDEQRIRLEAAEAASMAYEAASTEERIAIKSRELDDLKAREPWDCLHQLRLRLLEIDLEELRGLGADECERLRLEAHHRVSGRAYEPWVEPSPLTLDDSNFRALRADQPLVIGRQAERPTLDPLADYRERDDGRRHLEPRYH